LLNMRVARRPVRLLGSALFLLSKVTAGTSGNDGTPRKYYFRGNPRKVKRLHAND